MKKGNGKTIVLNKEQKKAIMKERENFHTAIAFCDYYGLKPPQYRYTTVVGHASEKTMRKLNKIPGVAIH